MLNSMLNLTYSYSEHFWLFELLLVYCINFGVKDNWG